MASTQFGVDFAVRFALDLLAIIVLVRLVYFERYHRTDLFLTLFGFNLVVFLVTWVMSAVDIGVGAAFGLFAVFSVLRYRTEGMSPKDMTYLFLGIALGLVTALSAAGALTLAMIALSVPLLTWILDSGQLIRIEEAQDVFYESTALIAPAHRDQLLAELARRLGLEVKRVEVREVDFVRDTARLTIYYVK